MQWSMKQESHDFSRVECQKKELWSTKLYKCEKTGEPSFAIGKLDVCDLWNAFSDIPLNPDTEETEVAFLDFPKGTFKEEIWHWFEKELKTSVHDLMYEQNKVDEELLAFNQEEFNLKENRIFNRKELQLLTVDKEQIKNRNSRGR